VPSINFLKYNNKKIPYELKKSSRAKRLRVAIYSDSRVVVTVPRGVLNVFTKRFLKERAGWIVKKVEHFNKVGVRLPVTCDREDYLKNKNEARVLINERLEYFNQEYKYKYNRVSVKNQKTRWGSCSRSGNLNFNYKILFLNKEQADYIIVHELCHLGELNHSKKFWNLVEKTIPNYYKIRRELKNVG